MDDISKKTLKDWEKLQNTRHDFISVMAQNMGLYGYFRDKWKVIWNRVVF
ncbi:hypothetical protein ACE1TI_01465 [Alteribacillus sp. JSM 102045]